MKILVSAFKPIVNNSLYVHIFIIVYLTIFSKFNLRNIEFEGFDCSCPYDDDHCKHGAALGLKFIDVIRDFSENGKNTEFDKDELEEYIDKGSGFSAARSPEKATGGKLKSRG